MKALLVLACLVLNIALAQTCPDYVAVDGVLIEGEAACYFGETRSVEDAYIRTDLLTGALGLTSSYDPETSMLRFRKGERQIEIQATSDAAAATTSRPGTLSVSGRPQNSLSAILAGSSYLPIKPLVIAFGGHVRWNETARMVLIDFNSPSSQTSRLVLPRPRSGMASSTERPVTRIDAAPANRTFITLGEPRYGLHESYTRVALDIPRGLEYQLAVDGTNFIVLFRGADARPFELTPEGPHLTSLGYAAFRDTLALIVGARHTLHENGRGFRVGRFPTDIGEVLYVDFGNEVRGEPIPKLQDLPKAQLASVRRPASVRKTVILDFGHGGKDPGAVSDFVIEKDLVLQVGSKLKTRLEARGIRVVLTRSDDRFIELEQRSRVAVPSKHNVFVSLHANSTETAGAQGIEAWVFGEPQDDSVIDLAIFENGGGEIGRARTRQARQTAGSIDGDLLREENLRYSTNLAERIQQALIAETGGIDRGVKQNVFSVLRNARIPAVLVELGFINHPVEGPKLATESYQDQLADALSRSIAEFLQQRQVVQRN